MIKIILIEKEMDFAMIVSDFLSLLSENDDYDVTVCDKLEKVGRDIAEYDPDVVIINAELAESVDLSSLRQEVRTYAKNDIGLNIAMKLPYKSYGNCGASGKNLADKIVVGSFITVEGAEEKREPSTKSSQTAPANPAVNDRAERAGNKKASLIPGDADDFENDLDDIFDIDGEEDQSDIFQTSGRQFQTKKPAEEPKPVKPAERPATKPKKRPQEVAQSDSPEQPSAEQTPKKSRNSRTNKSATAKPVREDVTRRPVKKEPEPEEDVYDDDDGLMQEEQPAPVQKAIGGFGEADLRSFAKYNRDKELAEAKEAERRQKLKETRDIDDEIDAEAGLTKPLPKIITCTSGKGGVGKTTISVELATYLAQTLHHRGKYKVCIVDLNIDFGNVSSTLDLDNKRSCMTYWAADIRERLERGYTVDDLVYSEAEIRTYLQQPLKDPRKRSDEPKEGLENLFVLCAPFSNDDAAGLTMEDVDIMLDNLIHYGGFDYIIIDTGNNTRDTTLLAIKKADFVILIMTQDANAAWTNRAYHNLFEAVSSRHDIDMNKFKLVINQAKPAKSVGISVEEVEQYMKGISKGHPIETISVLNDSNDVRKATNDGDPLTHTNSTHEFTKGIGAIAAYINGDEFTLAPKEKKGLFSKIAGVFKR